MQDASKILLGTIQSSYREGVTSYAVSDTADFPAGTIVRLDSNGDLSVTKADGQLLGVSLGIDMADTNRIVVLKAGLRVPVLLTDLGTDDYSQAVIGQYVWADDVTGKAQDVHDGTAVFSVVTSAIYVSGQMTGVNELGADVVVALVDMPGGL